MSGELEASQRISGSSAMAERTRAFAWEGTALGQVELWSDSLLAGVNTVLRSPRSTILMIGPDLVTLYNDAYIPTLAERHPQALGMRGDVLWADAWPAVGHQIEAVLREGLHYKFENVPIPIQRDGVEVTAYFTYSFSPVMEARDGSVLGVMCMAEDVTAVHQAALDLAENQAKVRSLNAELQQLLDATTDGVVHVNREWVFTYLNPAAVRMFAAGRNLVGKRVWDEFPNAYYPGSPYVEAYERATNDKVGSSFEAFYPEPLNLHMHVTVAPTPDGFVTYTRDITEEKRTAAMLMRTEKLAAVGRLASSISHEINNPLEAVTNLLYLARTEPDRDKITDLLATADDELRRVAAITTQTLRFHKQTTRPTRVACATLFAGALQMYKARLANARIQVQGPESDGDAVVVFEGEIRQVLNNLIGNAIDAMPTGGTLRLRCRKVSNAEPGKPGLRVTVADNGPGMAPEVQARLFEAFYTTKGIGGTGLGLWISKEIVTRHDGHLRVRSSQREGHRGTVFTFTLPFDNPVARLAGEEV